MNPYTTARLGLLSPEVREKFISGEQQLAANGITVEITQGGRTWNEQAALYAQSREQLDVVNAMRAGVGWASITDADNQRPVTWAQAGQSWHNYFMALDAVPFVGGKPLWNVTADSFSRMIAVFRSVGFVCGIDWPGQQKDSDHFQDSGKFPVSPTPEVMQLFKDGGTQAVWEAAYPA